MVGKAARNKQRRGLNPRTPKPAPERRSTLSLDASQSLIARLRPAGFTTGVTIDPAEGPLAALQFHLTGGGGAIVIELPWGGHKQFATAVLDLELPEPEEPEATDSGLVIAQPGAEHVAARNAAEIDKLKDKPTQRSASK